MTFPRMSRTIHHFTRHRRWISLAFGSFALNWPRPALAEVDPYDVVRRIADVLVRIEQDYVDPIERARLVDGATGGMVAELDPHSAYLTPAQFAQFLEDTQGQFAGIGVEVDFRNDQVTVISTMPSSPAERAGILPGDRIVAIDGVPVTGVRADVMVKRMRGTAGTVVKLTIRRDGRAEPISLDVTRAIVVVPSVEGRMLDGAVAYVRLKAFQEGCYQELLDVLADLGKTSRVRGLLLDLRSNPGGLVSEAVAIADEFLGNGVIYSARHRGKVVEVVSSHDGDLLEKIPLLVLVNASTASSAEIVAGALRDHGRATLVGEPTFGKGSVQNIIELPDGSGLLLTTLRYFTPNGHAIQARGLTPDILVEAQPNIVKIREADLDGHLQTEGTEETTDEARARGAVTHQTTAEPGSINDSPEHELTPNDAPKEQFVSPERIPLTHLPSDPSNAADRALAKAYTLLRSRLAH
ncbi:MAG: S41 family peptidase [Polyangiaceae bacterium]